MQTAMAYMVLVSCGISIKVAYSNKSTCSVVRQLVGSVVMCPGESGSDVRSSNNVLLTETTSTRFCATHVMIR